MIRAVDLTCAFVFAMEGAMAAAAGSIRVGVLVPAFVTARGGGVIRNLLIGATPLAAA
jgi:uncharacterized membrane protein YeiH